MTTRKQSKEKELRHKATNSTKHSQILELTAREIKTGELLLILDDQKKTKLREQLNEGYSKTKGTGQNLETIEDENGGRLKEATWLNSETRSPVFLAKESDLTYCIVRHFHEMFNHQNTNAAVAAVRQQYWVLHCKRVMQRVRGACQWCRNERAKPIQP